MPAKYVISRETAKRKNCFMSFIRKNEIAFYPHFTGRQSAFRDDTIRRNKGKNCI